MSPFLASDFTYLSAPRCSAFVSVGKSYIKYACTNIFAALNARSTFSAEASVIPFFISASSLSFAHSSPPVTAMHPAFAIFFASAGVNAASKRTFPHHSTSIPLLSISSHRADTSAGGIASSTKWTPEITGLGKNSSRQSAISAAFGILKQPMYGSFTSQNAHLCQ